MPYETTMKQEPLCLCADCLDVFALNLIPEQSLDMILCDLPYHITHNTWDTAIPLEDYVCIGERRYPFTEFERLLWNPNIATKHNAVKDLLNLSTSELQRFWKENKKPGLWTFYKKLIKPSGVIVLFGAGAFTGELMATGRDLWRYNIVWEKTHPTGFLNANRMPLRKHEDILVFYRKLPVYHPQKTTGHPRKVSTAQHKRNVKRTTNYREYEFKNYDSTDRYPTSIWRFGSDTQKSTLHSTQKPVALCEELIKTYTDEGAIVMDNCAGSFTTSVACDNLNRNWIAIEKGRTYFDTGLNRVNENRALLGLPFVKEKKI